mgnify:CR=1 FL=1
MRVLVLFAHPVETSFGAAVHHTLVTTLAGRGHEIDDCDLNAEGFDPVMSRQDRIEQAKADWKAGRMSLPPGDDVEFIPLPEDPPKPPERMS